MAGNRMISLIVNNSKVLVNSMLLEDIHNL